MASTVSIHAPARGATPAAQLAAKWYRSFNPRARAGRDHQAGGLCRRQRLFQSTRPRGARRGTGVVVLDVALVSIHAPARGATCRGGEALSVHVRRFNPRARAGRDRKVARYRGHTRGVSIHAPARGATLARPSRRRHGFVFQSTRPRGARPISHCRRIEREHVSIHAPARGATRQRVAAADDARVSIHAPARGATRALVATTSLSTVSIHAPARGATSSNDHDAAQTIASFNPRARAGRDLGLCCIWRC